MDKVKVIGIKDSIGKYLVNELFKSTEWALRKRLKWDGAISPPKYPNGIWQKWINTTLKSGDDVEAAWKEVRSCGLPPHPDKPKNWDFFTALGLILGRTSMDANILDAGAPIYSVMLPWLYMYGYRNLLGIDLVYSRSTRRGPIRYEKVDLTRTHFGDGTFDIITCLSVIEHGVSFDAYFKEMSRILRPGGILITSTDYWIDPIPTQGQISYGTPIKIFSWHEMESFLKMAETFGLRSIKPVDLRCQERVVLWEQYGFRYTFLNLTVEKVK